MQGIRTQKKHTKDNIEVDNKREGFSAEFMMWNIMINLL